MPGPIRVLVIDDSVFMRTMLKDALAKASGIDVIGTAQNGTEGLQKIERLRPDAVTLDFEMPGMNGLEVLAAVMKRCPTPIVMVSTKTQAGAKLTLEALELGAVDYVAKPVGRAGSTLESFREEVVRAIQAAAASNRKTLAPARVATPPLAKPVGFGAAARTFPTDRLIAIGISAGGPQTLHRMLPTLPAGFPPIVITQHMPEGFTKAFADRLHETCACDVKEAENGDVLRNGLVLIAPGDHHLIIQQQNGRLIAALSHGPKVSGFRPSADAMFDSIAKICPERTIAVIMTGMGFDGAAGLKKLKGLGAYTIAQDAATSVVYGMPKAAAETGCVDRIVPVEQIPATIMEMLKPAPIPARV